MNRKTVISGLIFTIILTYVVIPTAKTNAFIKHTPYCNKYSEVSCKKFSNEINCNDRPRFWTEENLKYLTDSEKKQLLNLQQKLKSGIKLTDGEKRQLWAYKDIVVKSKLGDEKFADFKNIMTKKKNGQKLSDDEISRIKSYFNQIKGE